jgi:cytochrome c oxidase subunit I
MTTSPPPIENFEGIPVLATGPYDYGMEQIQGTGESLKLKLRENASRSGEKRGIPVSETQASTVFGGTATLVNPESETDVDVSADESPDAE